MLTARLALAACGHAAPRLLPKDDYVEICDLLDVTQYGMPVCRQRFDPSLTPEDGTDKFSRNVGNNLEFHAA